VTLCPEFLVERPGSPFLHHETVTPSHDFTTEAPEPPLLAHRSWL